MSNAPGIVNGLASIVVVRSARSRPCLASLARRASRPRELIVVADGSIDGEAAYLAGFADAASFPVRVVAADVGLGRPSARARGLAVARGEYLVLLDDDVAVVDGWLDQLVALADSSPSIGAVGPMTDFAVHPQFVPDAPRDGDLDSMRRFAETWRRERLGRWLEAARLSTACMLVKRRAFEAVGRLGGRFGAEPIDDDWTPRVRDAGFSLAVAHDLFVHRLGDRTSTSRGRVALRDGAAAGDGRRARVSLTMIVRDEESNLPACLDSVRGLFDEVVVVDTGSTDRTVEIARSFGARVFDFAWVDDFAAARNAALARATGDYAFWLDADDRLDPPNRERLRALFDGLRPGGPAHVVRCSCDADPDGGGATVVDHVRLFPIREDVRWDYRVHEQILPALRRAGVDVRWTDAVVRHVGYNDPVARRGKLERDRRILESEAADRPDDPFVLFNLGQVAMEFGEVREALGFLRRSLAGSDPSASIVRKLHALIARGHQLLGDSREAMAACDAGLADEPDDVELLFRKGVLHRLGGASDAARACWERILTIRRPEKFASVDEGLHGHVTRRNLAVLAEERGDLADARRHWTAVRDARPDDPEPNAALERIGRVPAAAGPG